MLKYKIPQIVTLTQNWASVFKLSHPNSGLTQENTKKTIFSDSLFCDRDRIQTCNRLIRSQLLYSVELRDLIIVLKSDRDRIQTCNRLIRSQLLYSVELRGHCLLFFRFNGCKDTDFFWKCKRFTKLFSKNYSTKRELNSCQPSVKPTFQSLDGEL